MWAGLIPPFESAPAAGVADPDWALTPPALATHAAAKLTAAIKAVVIDKLNGGFAIGGFGNVVILLLQMKAQKMAQSLFVVYN